MRPFVLGLTGSMGMGKSTTSRMFADFGLPVWDADGVVHRLYAPGGAAVPGIAAAFPAAIRGGGVDRDRLRALIAADPGALDRLNAIVHPLVSADRAAFLRDTTAPVVVLDVPLLFETGADALCDGVAVVSVPEEVQHARLLARGTMDAPQIALILARQMGDAEKRARARWVIDTSTLESARAAVQMILAEIRGGQVDA